MEDDFAQSAVSKLDRQIEEAMDRIMSGTQEPQDYGIVSDLNSRRVELTEPAGFARLEALLSAA